MEAQEGNRDALVDLLCRQQGGLLEGGTQLGPLAFGNLRDLQESHFTCPTLEEGQAREQGTLGWAEPLQRVLQGGQQRAITPGCRIVLKLGQECSEVAGDLGQGGL